MSLKKYTLNILLTILPFISYAGSGRGDYHTVYHGQGVDDLIIKYMEDNHIPGLSLAIVQAPYITRLVGYGIADQQTQNLVATHTIFNIGQITNGFTGVAIMQLKEEGKLALEDSITKYIGSDKSEWKDISIKDLMLHSSGLPSFTDQTNFDFNKNYTSTEIVDLIKNKPLLFTPGTKVYTSASNNYLLGAIIEKASGMSYQDYITKNQIQRLNLKHTFFISNLNEIANEMNNGSSPFKHTQFLHNAVDINPTEIAAGYSKINDQLQKAKLNSWTATYANAGIVASAEDISLWDISLAGEILVKDPADRAFLYSPQKLKNGQIVPGNVGWLFPGHKGLMEIKGNVPGYSTFLSRFTAPTELLCVTLLTNKTDLPDLDILGRKIAGAFDSKLEAPAGAAWTETVQSPYSVAETMNRVATIIKMQGGKVFATIDHSQEATNTGQSLPPTQVLIVGNPAKGTSIMQKNPPIALDLPLRIMARQDKTGQVWLSFTDPVLLAKEYGIEGQDRSLRETSQGLRKVVAKAVSVNTIFTPTTATNGK